MISKHPAVAALPARGDIVMCFFPLAEEPDRPGNKARPCVVVDVHQRDGALFAEIAYGTDAAHTSNSGFHFEITEEAEYLAASLKKPTRFVLARSTIVPVSADYLDYNGAGSATIGSLPPKARQEFDKKLRARIARCTQKTVVICRLPRRKTICRPISRPAAI